MAENLKIWPPQVCGECGNPVKFVGSSKFFRRNWKCTVCPHGYHEA